MGLTTPNKSYCIRIDHNMISRINFDVMKKYWKDFDVNVHSFDAVTPLTLHLHNDLEFGIKKSGRKVRPFTETEKCIWYSHYLLWKKIVREKRDYIIVMEHDCFPYAKLPPISFILEKEILLLAKNRKRITMAGVGYALSLNHAKYLLQIVEKGGKINSNVDAFIMHTLRKRFYQGAQKLEASHEWPCAVVNNIIHSHRTIDHAKGMKKDEYEENLNLSSLRW